MILRLACVFVCSNAIIGRITPKIDSMKWMVILVCTMLIISELLSTEGGVLFSIEPLEAPCKCLTVKNIPKAGS